MPRTILLPVLLLLSCRLFAWNADNTASLQDSERVGFSISPLTAVTLGYTDELVYGSDSGSYPYLSQLHWEIKPAVTLGVEGALNLENRFFLNVALGKALNIGTGEMTDRDWISDYFDYSDTEWTHESVSSITLNKSFFLDINGAYRLYNRKQYSLDLKAGFKLLRWGWTDRITSVDYTYVSSDPPWEDLTPAAQNSLVGLNGIDYVVNYKIPYLGLRGQGQWGAFSAGMSLGFSFFVFADDRDYHKLRTDYDSSGLVFKGNFSMGKYLGFSSFLRLHMSRVLVLSAAYDLDWVPEIKGDTTYTSGSGYYLGTTLNSAGVSYFAQSLSLSLGISLR